MGRKKTTINPERGKRVKEIIKDAGMNQASFASDVLHCSSNHLSYMVTGKRNVTEQDIDIIYKWAIRKGMDIRKEWLLCIDDIKTDASWFSKSAERTQTLSDAVNNLIEAHGYMISDYVYPRVIKDEDGREYQQHFISLTAPNGDIHLFRPEDFRSFQNNINNIVEGLLLLEYKSRLGDYTKVYIKPR